jgi:hypothetical protein
VGMQGRSGGWRLAIVIAGVAAACRGQHEGAGTPSTERVSKEARASRAAAAKTEPGAKQILFGDLHVHTTFSADAFIASLPMLQGQGAHPPADACDFARFCSALDFWSINDHAETVTPEHWQETKDAIRQCNEVSGDPADPDLVSFLGWEWTQVGATPDDHYGHKNVIFRETAEDRVPTRPISALSARLVGALRQQPPLWERLSFLFSDWSRRQRYLDFARFQEEIGAVPICPSGVDSRKLPADCHEAAQTPQELFEKLAQWGFEAIVIPHGTTWGFYTPPGTTFDKQITPAQHDSEKQILFEVFSGHGNSEEFRTWKDIDRGAGGEPVCPAPTADYEPCCWRAGEIIRSRCGDAPAEECEHRVAEAQTNFLDAGVAGRTTVPATDVADWKDCGQCRTCFLPSYNYRPGNSAQYALALSDLTDPQSPKSFRFGFIASSDNHSARPGTGYKEMGRLQMTEARGAETGASRRRILGPEADEVPNSVALDPKTVSGIRAMQVLDFERQASFFLTGGLVAVHSEARNRDASWSSFQRRETYGTSGDRILLWFDLLNAPSGTAPMGSEVALGAVPRFRVRAIGAQKQRPGCPDDATSALGVERLAALCRGECHNPSDERRAIRRIEIVRIRPAITKDEPVAPRIEDPWKRFECPADAEACTFEFEDAEFPGFGREVVYYVRAVQEPTPAVNAGGVRCEYDEKGNCVEAHPCYGDYRTAADDDCTAPNEERAWSSPIYLRPSS